MQADWSSITSERKTIEYHRKLAVQKNKRKQEEARCRAAFKEQQLGYVSGNRFGEDTDADARADEAAATAGSGSTNQGQQCARKPCKWCGGTDHSRRSSHLCTYEKK